MSIGFSSPGITCRPQRTPLPGGIFCFYGEQKDSMRFETLEKRDLQRVRRLTNQQGSNLPVFIHPFYNLLTEPQPFHTPYYPAIRTELIQYVAENRTGRPSQYIQALPAQINDSYVFLLVQHFHSFVSSKKNPMPGFRNQLFKTQGIVEKLSQFLHMLTPPPPQWGTPSQI